MEDRFESGEIRVGRFCLPYRIEGKGQPAIVIGSALLLEDALVRHPKARVYIAHAGWPFADDMVAMLYQYPELYVDVAWIDWYLPRAEFHGFLKRLVDAGFADRIMWHANKVLLQPGRIGTERGPPRGRPIDWRRLSAVSLPAARLHRWRNRS